MTKTERARKTRLAYLRTFCGDTESPHVNGDRGARGPEEVLRHDRSRNCVSSQSGHVDPYATAYLPGSATCSYASRSSSASMNDS
jgi:hypothetical protein